jgi:hypothetical protein
LLPAVEVKDALLVKPSPPPLLPEENGRLAPPTEPVKPSATTEGKVEKLKKALRLDDACQGCTPFSGYTRKWNKQEMSMKIMERAKACRTVHKRTASKLILQPRS